MQRSGERIEGCVGTAGEDADCQAKSWRWKVTQQVQDFKDLQLTVSS